MKSFNILLAAFLVLNVAYGQEIETKKDYSLYGTPFTPNKILTVEAMADAYKNLKVGDSLSVAFSANVNEVCQAKGCWMNLQLNEEEGKEVLVKFKDYGFFVPTDLNKNLVIVNGKAFVEELSVDEQRHYAHDAGKSRAEVAKITEPKRTLRFEAAGVLIEE
ncbi:DUF4920 domain-containing protein [Allomuricauda sp. d1]|uniref:DUF4920 domain-containing protein n=1 Tax=Allomuricauda sp. d1 TaxID=3136725 RepID=UPI0031D464B2